MQSCDVHVAVTFQACNMCTCCSDVCVTCACDLHVITMWLHVHMLATVFYTDRTTLDCKSCDTKMQPAWSMDQSDLELMMSAPI